jgi:hypothetical protein
MPCINSTSFGEAGGNTPVVEAGRVFVGCPGAPGCTITGVFGLACCASIDSVNNKATAAAAMKALLNLFTIYD